MSKRRFNGLSEEDVKKKDALPDYLEPDLDVVFLGINPSLMAAHTGRYYAGPGNHFYKLLHASNLVSTYVPYQEDSRLLEYKIGLTNIVARATRSSSDLNVKEIKEGCAVVAEKMKKFKPRVAVFNGKCIYQVFAQHFFNKTQFEFGLQPEKLGETFIWVVPSSSARCSSFPRMENKLPFFLAIKKHLQFIKGEIFNFDLKEFEFKDSSKRKKNIEYAITEIVGESVKETSSEFFKKESELEESKESLEEKQKCEIEKENRLRPVLKPFSPKKLEKTVEKTELKRNHENSFDVSMIQEKIVYKSNLGNEEPKPKKKLNFSNLRKVISNSNADK